MKEGRSFAYFLSTRKIDIAKYWMAIEPKTVAETVEIIEELREGGPSIWL